MSCPAHAIEESIPWLDMSHFATRSPKDKIALGRQFGEAFHTLGFVAVSNFGIQQTTIDEAYAAAAEFFKLPDDIKNKVLSPDGHQGYTPFGKEHAKYTDVMDLKEFFQITGINHPDHLWPDLPDFKHAMVKLYDELQDCMRACLQATAIYLGYEHPEEQNVLADLIGTGYCVMRPIHYPAIPDNVIPSAIRAAAHEDLGIMTIVPRATAPGLQAQKTDGTWLNVTVPEGAAIINAGDVLSMVTNGMIPSTTHRVVNPDPLDKSDRYSIPFFGNLPADTPLRVLNKCIGNTRRQDLPKEVTFGEFMRERYAEIGIG